MSLENYFLHSYVIFFKIFSTLLYPLPVFNLEPYTNPQMLVSAKLRTFQSVSKCECTNFLKQIAKDFRETVHAAIEVIGTILLF